MVAPAPSPEPSPAGQPTVAGPTGGSAHLAGAPARLTTDLAAALGGGALVVFVAALLALRAQPGAPAPADLLVAAGLLGAGCALVVARLAGLVRAAPVFAAVLGLAAGAGLGAAVGAVASGLSSADGTLVGAAAATAAAVMNLVVVRAAPGSWDGTAGPAATARTAVTAARAGSSGPVATIGAGAGRRLTAGAVVLAAMLPLTVAAPVVYLVGRHLPG